MFDENADGEIASAREIAFTKWLEDGVDLSEIYSVEQAAQLDADNNGVVTSNEVLQEFYGTADQLEALDTNEDGSISDLEALAGLFDTNRDGVLDASDNSWDKFTIWNDANSNGEIDDGELLTLDSEEITGFALQLSTDESYLISDGSFVNGLLDVYRADGVDTLAADVSLNYAGNGVQIDERADGSIDYTFESGVVEQHIQLQTGNTNYSVVNVELSLDFDFDLLAQANTLQVVTSVTGSAGANIIDATEAGLSVVLDGGADDDTLTGSEYGDTLVGGDGNDTLIGGADELEYTTDADGNSYAVTLDSDILQGGAGADTLRGGGGGDILIIDQDDITNGEVDGGSGYDAALVDYEDGDAGISITLSDHDIEYFRGGGGDDTISAYELETRIYIDPTNAELYLHRNNVTQSYSYLVETESGTYSNYGTYKTDTLTSTGQSFDWLIEPQNSTDGNSADASTNVSFVSFTLLGGAGDDYVSGALGGDQIVGGTGDDRLEGGYGNDVYYFGAGDGHDTIYDVGRAPNSSTTHDSNYSVTQITATTDFGGIDTLQFGGEIRFENLSFSQSGADVTIAVETEDEDGQTINDSVRIEDFSNEHSAVELIGFSNGMYVDIRNVMNGLGNDGNNANLVGGDESDVLQGFAGNDKLVGLLGADFLSGDEGNDRLEGGGGADTYYYKREDGDDVIRDFDADDTEQGSDILAFGAGIAFSDLSFSIPDTDYFGDGGAVADASSNDLLITISETIDDVTSVTGRITIQDYFEENSRIEWLVFDDGSSLNAATTIGLALSTDGDDTTTWTQSVISIDGGEGDDRITAGEYDDYLDGGAGNDILVGGGGDDILTAGTGTAMQYLHGQTGNDTYLYAKDNGRVLIGGQSENATSGDADRVVFTDLNLSDITVGYYDYGTDHLHGNALRLSWNDGTNNGEIRVANEGDAIEAFQFADGSSFSSIEIGTSGRINLHGTDSNDFIVGSSQSDVIYGGAGDDLLSAGAGEGTSWQYLYGEDGDDTYLYSKEDGRVFIGAGAENSTSGGADRVVFTDLNLSDITISYYDYAGTGSSVQGNALRLTWNDGTSNGELRIANEGDAIEAFQFADGSSFSSIELDDNGFFYGRGTDGDDLLIGSNGRDIILAGDGDDVLSAGAGTSMQHLYGQDGNDTYLYSKDNGSVSIGATAENATSGEADRVVFTDLNLSDISVGYFDYGVDHLNGNALRLTWNDGTSNGELRIANEGDAIEAFQFADGTVFDLATSTGGMFAGTSGNDLLVGSLGFDDLLGNSGDDALLGGSGDDKLFGQDGNDTLIGGAGVNRLYGGAGDDTFVFHIEDDKDFVFDSAFSEVIDASEIAAAADAGVAATGGSVGWVQVGDAVYNWQSSNDRLIKLEDAGTDTLSLGAGIELDDLTFTWGGTGGNHLYIYIGDQTDGYDIRLTNQAFEESAIETIEFHDGSSYDLSLV